MNTLWFYNTLLIFYLSTIAAGKEIEDIHASIGNYVAKILN